MKLEDIGINSFFNEEVSYNGIFTLKHRYDDFIVKEIQDGGICDIGPIFNYREIKNTIQLIIGLSKEHNIENDIIKNTVNYAKENLETLERDICITDIDSIFECDGNNLFNLKYEDNSCIGEFKIDQKEKREEWHKIIRNHPLLHSKTDINKNFVIEFGNRSSAIYSFTLMKMNKDTLEACSIIAKELSIAKQEIKFAGNKDRRAVTFQRVTVKGQCFYEIVKLAKLCVESDAKVKIFDIKQELRHINLGELQGNRFEINIRCRDPQNNYMLKSLDFTRMERGFINYYGQQRFGKGFNNHTIGKFLLEKDYKKAIDSIMMVLGNTDDLLEAKMHFKNQEYNLCYEKLPYRYSIERNIAYNKSKNQNDKKIISSLRNESIKLYFHAYQSYIFNFEANEAINFSKNNLDTVFLDLKKEKSKHLKGGRRKLIQRVNNLSVKFYEDFTKVIFDLPTSCYATMALREVIGNDVLF